VSRARAGPPLRRALLDWYASHARDLPWRRTDDPYRIWVAEIMLQQTQVATVIPYYESFLERFPDVRSLAGASEDEVLAAWSGLGYYRRARSLLAGARTVAERHGGRVPDDVRALRALPGIGRYTAGAVASVAFGRPEPVLDGNVRRVLSRIFAVDGVALGPAREQATLWELAADLVAGPRPGDLNQALMELGATVCTPARPACAACPARFACRARAEGRVPELPVRRPAPPSIAASVGVAWIARDGRVLLERWCEGMPLRGKWDLPAAEGVPGLATFDALARRLAGEHGLELAAPRAIGALRHGIMRRRLVLEAWRCRLVRGGPRGRERLRWVAADEIERTAVSGATRKIARLVRGVERNPASAHIRPSGNSPTTG
jgi:A/G-specific adenine glycosylase